MKYNRFIKNTSWLLVGNIFRMVFQFLINILIARYLGPEKQGILNYVATYTSFFISLVSLGINGVIVYELVNNKEDGKIVGTSIVLRAITAVISMFLMMVIIYTIDGANSDIVRIAFLQAIQLPFSALDTIKYWYQKRLQSKTSVLVVSTGYFISSIYRLYILFTHKGLQWFGFSTTLDIIIIGILYVLAFRKHSAYKLSFDLIAAKRILRACIPFTLANIMIFIYSKIDTIMIRHILNSMEQVGLYTTAVAVCGYISFVPTAILDSARPLIMESKAINKDLYHKRMKQAIIAVVLVGVLYASFISILGVYVIQLLYGNSYLGAVGSLRIAVWYTAFAFLGSVKSIWLICENKNKYVFVYSIMGAITNIFLNAIMIPVWGIEGAAMATLFTQAATHIIYPAFIPDTRDFVITVKEAVLLRGIR